MAHRRTDQPTALPEYDNPSGCLPRLFWMAFGNIGLILAAQALGPGVR
jgi:hypothetical protein